MSLWWLSLALGVVVIGVVAYLLSSILHTARAIEGVAQDIWDGGKRIANNTVHVPDLIRTNGFAESLLQQAPLLGDQLKRIKGHAENCPGCPVCVVGGNI